MAGLAQARPAPAAACSNPAAGMTSTGSRSSACRLDASGRRASGTAAMTRSAISSGKVSAIRTAPARSASGGTPGAGRSSSAAAPVAPARMGTMVPWGRRARRAKCRAGSPPSGPAASRRQPRFDGRNAGLSAGAWPSRPRAWQIGSVASKPANGSSSEPRRTPTSPLCHAPATVGTPRIVAAAVSTARTAPPSREAMTRISRAVRPPSCHAAGTAEASAEAPGGIEVRAFTGTRLSRNPSRSQDFRDRLRRHGYWTQDIARGFSRMTQRASLPDDVL